MRLSLACKQADVLLLRFEPDDVQILRSPVLHDPEEDEHPEISPPG